jgi:hypothetical protein
VSKGRTIRQIHIDNPHTSMDEDNWLPECRACYLCFIKLATMFNWKSYIEVRNLFSTGKV